MKTMGFSPLSHHAPQLQKILAHESSQQTMNICSTNAAHAKKGMYLLSMHPRSLLVCRMFQLSSCLYRKQSFHTRLNSANEPPPPPPPPPKGVPMLINIFRTKKLV